MNQSIFKDSIIWVNIGELAIQNGKFACSVYQSAHFYGSCQNSRLLIRKI